METIKDVLCFLNRLDFKEILDGDLIEEMGCVKRQLVIEFGDYDIATMVYAPDNIDKMIVLIITNKLIDFKKQKDTLRKKFII